MKTYVTSADNGEIDDYRLIFAANIRLYGVFPIAPMDIMGHFARAAVIRRIDAMPDGDTTAKPLYKRVL
ncbi:MAG: hypothetical protein L3J37_13245, partial [Rhodobacteraceae bacterium]|nr:hypothetical protein [Paracoccaceae bacterium]